LNVGPEKIGALLVVPSSFFFCFGFLLFFPSGVILMILQTGEDLLLSWIPGTETSSSFDSEFLSFLKLGGYITTELPAILLLQ